MKRYLGAFASVGLLLGMLAGETALAQKPGGVLKMSHFDSPASMSLHEEVTAAANRPMMGVFNNLVMYKQDVPQNSLQSIVPDLAVSWSWSEEGTELTFPLRQGVKWHDGKPFTAHDVKCTWDTLTGKSENKLRLNPRKSWYRNLEEVSVNGDYEVTFRLKRPQPSFLALLASGWSPIYPCHVAPRDMRTHPIGTGPFKFVEFKPNEVIRVTRNPDYWKPGRPYLDGIEYRIIPNLATIGFVGSPPMNFLTLPIENGCIRLGALTLVSPAATGGQIVLGIRPEDLAPADAAEGFPFALRVAEPLGSHIMLTGETAGQHVRVVVPPETPVHIGVTMHLNPRRDRIVWMDPASGTAVGSKEADRLGNKAEGD